MLIALFISPVLGLVLGYLVLKLTIRVAALLGAGLYSLVDLVIQRESNRGFERVF